MVQFPPKFLCISVLRVASGPRVKLYGCKCLVRVLVVYLLTVLRRWSRCRSYSLLLCGLFYEAIFFKSCLLCYYFLVFFSPCSIAIASLREERANLSVFRTLVRFALVCFCLIPLPLCVWEGLRLVTVALPGLFSYLFYKQTKLIEKLLQLPIYSVILYCSP